MRGRDVVIISTQDYSDLRTRKQRWAERLAAQNRVLYVETQMHWVTLLRHWPRLRRRLRKAGRPPREVRRNLWVWTPPIVLPFFQMSRLVGLINRKIIQRSLKREIDALGFRDLLLWLYTPYSASLIGDLEPRNTVYECVDDFAAARGLIRPTLVRHLEDETFRRADLTIVTAESLLRHAEVHSPCCRLSPNACDLEFFAQADREDVPVHQLLQGLPRPIYGFVGAVAYWVDLDLLARLARSHSDATVLVVGPVRASVSAYRSIPNLIFLGQQPYERIPNFLRGFDVCLNPYKRNDLANGASPLKLYEYVAAGKPVVSTDLPEARRFSEVVRVAENPDQFLMLCRQAADETLSKSQTRRLRQMEMMRPHSWESRFAEMDEWLRETGIDSCKDRHSESLPTRRVTLRRPPELKRSPQSDARHVVINGLQVTGPEMGGGFSYLTNLLPHLVRQHPEIKFTVVTTSKGARHLFWPLNNLSRIILPDVLAWGPLRFLYERHLMHRLLERTGAQVYFSPYGALPRVRICPQVMAFQNLYFFHAREFASWQSPSLWGRFYERRRLRSMTSRLLSDCHSAERIVAVSHTAASELLRRAAVSADSVTVVHEAAGKSFESQGHPQKDLAIQGDLGLPTRYFLTVGALAPNKNLPHLLTGYHEFLRANPNGPALVLAGPDWRGFSRRVLRQAQQLGISDAVRWIGFIDPEPLASLYRNAVAVVLLSSCESFGLPALEAMACGSPVMVANRSGLSEIAGDAAIQVDPGDYRAIAGHLERLSNDPAWRIGWIRRGLGRAREFSWDDSARGTYQAIAEAAGWIPVARETEPPRALNRLSRFSKNTASVAWSENRCHLDHSSTIPMPR